mmetsp:Transcript_48893/g.111385  ORF Transcript_48893/g.111385 Transcript_48893/m.111385 type:complete len:210 (+) Transcript_48893:1088-1717(+)
MRSCLERTPLMPMLVHNSFNSGAAIPSNSSFFCTTTERIRAAFALISARICASCARRASIICSFLPFSSPAVESSSFKSSRYMAFSSFFRAATCSSSRLAATSSSLTSSSSLPSSASISISSASTCSSTFFSFFERGAAGFLFILPAGATTSSCISSTASSSMAILPALPTLAAAEAKEALAATALRLMAMMSAEECCERGGLEISLRA